MDEHPQDLESSRDSVRRRLETPGRGEPRPATRSRSRSRLRTRSPSRLHREPGLGQSLERIDLLERELQRERQRVDAARRRRSSPRRVSEHREEHRHRSSSRRSGAVPPVEQRREHRNDGDLPRSRSPSFSKRDVIDIFNSIKCGLPSQPSTQVAPHQKLDHKNILPNFDPSTKNQRIDVWLKKVNECASVYGWDERTTTHFAMQKLQGLAKTWYEGLNSILFTWQQWQDKLVNAFPYEQNYGQALEDMLKRKSQFNEPIEVYFYEKQTLVNQCDIVGKRAVDCIIHGLTDRTLRSGALALRCTDPDQLLQYLLECLAVNFCNKVRGSTMKTLFQRSRRLTTLLMNGCNLESEYVMQVEWEKSSIQELDVTATDLSTECLIDMLTRIPNLRFLSAGQINGFNDSVLKAWTEAGTSR
ncbi:unnamed protein product [Plutella xylostella]|uniref:(diamondback moth) hypothetical protein n=1 Tax=Plutella xylostella TaxID=51655 RepID=A0A8S4EWM4_PLUXY|nr:unnamed protein product [Plutella xylostella]